MLQSFAENTMNELLGWYGYDKVELRDSDSLEIGETPQHISVLKGMKLFSFTLTNSNKWDVLEKCMRLCFRAVNINLSKLTLKTEMTVKNNPLSQTIDILGC